MGYYKEKMKNLLLIITTILISNLYNAQELMPMDGSWQTWTTDAGILYDDGGDLGNYVVDGVGTLTIYPTDQVNDKIFLQFAEFVVESQATCDYDFLEIYDGDDLSNLVGKYCGSTLPNSIQSTHPTGAVTLVWSSDYSITYSGFKANVTAIDPSTIVQLGDPNSTTTNGRVPSYGYYDYSWSALIYSAAEVGVPIIIDEIQFDVENNINTTMTNQKIFIAHTTMNMFPDGSEPVDGDISISDWTLVYTGDITWSQGWNTITLDNTFSYNGIGNVLIKTINEHGSWTTDYPEFRYTAKANTVVYNYADGGMPSSLGWRNNYRPNMRLGFGGGASLPIELIDFNGILNEERVELSWTTASEINNSYFIVEKSKDGVDWVEVRKVSGAGHSTSIIDYFEIDNDPLIGLSYYRLTQVDFDGKQETFNIIPIENAIKGEGIMNIYPNPVNKGDCISLSFKSLHKNKQEILVVLRDIRGNEAYSIIKFVDCKEGLIFIDIPHHLTSGTYLVVATSENLLYSKKITIK